MSLQRIRILTALVVAGKASKAEQLELAGLIDQTADDTALAAIMQEAFSSTGADLKLPDEMKHRIMTSIPFHTTITAQAPVVRMKKWKWVAAAAVVAMLGAGVYYLLQQPAMKPDIIVQQQEIIPPGKEGAILTLADGRQIVLDSMGNGIVARESGAAIKVQNGILAYEGKATGEAGFNTIATPAGRQYQVVLPDGSKVWLNAASSLRYPTAFNDQHRTVELTGEAYFEVAKNAKQQFSVSVNGRSSVEVLGTSFNIDAYNNETVIRTTLLEGAVKVSNTGNARPVMLKPGQQAQQHHAVDDKISVLQQVDLNSVMAWKNNKFNFEGMPLKEIMQQLERWYGITVMYEGTPPPFEFYGELSRNNSLNDILEAFKDSDLHFKLEGRNLTIMK